MRKNAVLSAVLVFALCSALPAVADLRVATASTYPPYEFLNEKGMLDGFDHDLMEEIGRRIGEKIQWVDTGHYDMVIPTLVTNRADVIAAGMSATPIRARRVLFSTPYVPTMACFVTAPSFTVRKLEDLKGLRGAVPVGTTQDVFLTPRAAQYGYTIKTFAKIEECMWDIVTGRSDFTLMDVPVAEKLLANRFTLSDYMDQMNQLKGMGDLSDLAGMIPGMDAKALKGAKVDEKSMAHQEAIILSMTQAERDNPSLLNSSRKKRIAAGSGTSVVEVNRLLKQFEAMQQMVKQFSGKNMKKLQKKMGRMGGGGGFPGLGGFGF